MKKVPAISLMLLLTWFNSQGQHLEILGTTGIGMFRMKDLKGLNNSVIESLPFPAKVTADFPPRACFGGRLTYTFRRNYKLGLSFEYASTGSRISSRDYSGSYRLDNLVRSSALGIINEFRIAGWNGLQLDITVLTGPILSNIRMEEELQVADTSFTDLNTFRALGFFAEPQLTLTWEIRWLKFGIYIGYLLDSGGELTAGDGGKYKTSVSWTGLRAGLILGISTRKTKPNEWQ